MKIVKIEKTQADFYTNVSAIDKIVHTGMGSLPD